MELTDRPQCAVTPYILRVVLWSLKDASLNKPIGLVLRIVCYGNDMWWYAYGSGC